MKKGKETHKALFTKYLKDITKASQHGDAREESFYPAFGDMLAQIAAASGRKNVHVTTQPKRTDAGNPDFRLWNGKDRIIGYIVAKKPTERDLDKIEESEQLQRYLSTFPNVILTNFLEFRLYHNGELLETVVAGRPSILNQLHTTPPVEKPAELYALLDRFMSFEVDRPFTAATLAIELAKRTRFLRIVVEEELSRELTEPGLLAGFYEAFQTYLIGTLSRQDFADLFSQTITYGLFAARTRTPKDFNRRVAFDKIPQTIGVLRDLFQFVSFGKLPEQLVWCVDDIAEILAVADAKGILDRYYHEGRGSDPIIHFYETFLAKYDSEERERRGVYYTPEEVVGYIVRSLHSLLKTRFGKPDGLASDKVTLLDPAAGTMTFVAQAAKFAVSEFVQKYGSGGCEDFIRRHILRNFYAFELMMAPYAVGHLKMGFFLEELGYQLSDDERVQFYLTNTLDTEELEQSNLPGLSALAHESRLAGKVKKETPILVILGNPPYSGHSSNPSDVQCVIKKGQRYVVKWVPKVGGGAVAVETKATKQITKRQPTFIGRLIRDYFFVDDQPLGEKNPKWLHDDYVKFLRFAQWKIAQSNRGAVGMITNHSYLDNPTFRGMRQSLIRSFDEIYVLDLHGNTLKKELSPDGAADQNVFDIRQGVAIVFLLAYGSKSSPNATVRHAEIFGKRTEKNSWLISHEAANTKWTELKPRSPSYLFVPRDDSLVANYERHLSVAEVFPINSVGIVTARDSLTIQFTAEEIWSTVTVFSQLDVEVARQGYRLGDDRQDWQVSLAQRDLVSSGPKRDLVVPILYRPFDIRYTYYTARSRGFICRPRPEVMQHMLAGENKALVTARTNKSHTIDHFYCSAGIVEAKCGESTVQSYTFPLYLYPVSSREDLFTHHESQERRANLHPQMISAMRNAFLEEPTPEDVFTYTYAVLYSPTYRAKYAEFLRMDFPRIPFTADLELFSQIAQLGGRLVELHLLRSPELDPPACHFDGDGDGNVESGRKAGLHYQSEEERVYINETQYFAPIPEQVWSYQIGGYQVCEKWLKDRRGRHLDLDEIRTYCRVVTALGLTIEIQEEIDKLYPQVEEDVINMQAESQDSRQNHGTGKKSRKSIK